MDTVGEFPHAADQSELGQDGELGERESRSLEGPDEFANSISRVAGKHCYFPAPSELHVTVARHAAQAFTNAPRGTRPL